MRPKRLTAACAIASTAAGSATSPSTAMALPPAASISRTTSSASALFERTLTTTDAPACANCKRDGAADIAPGAGDDGDFAGEFFVCQPLQLPP